MALPLSGIVRLFRGALYEILPVHPDHILRDFQGPLFFVDVAPLQRQRLAGAEACLKNQNAAPAVAEAEPAVVLLGEGGDQLFLLVLLIRVDHLGVVRLGRHLHALHGVALDHIGQHRVLKYLTQQKFLLFDSGGAHGVQAVDIHLHVFQPDRPDVHIGQLILAEELQAKLVPLVGAGPDLSLFEFLQPVQHVVGQGDIVIRSVLGDGLRHNSLLPRICLPSPEFFLRFRLFLLCQLECLEPLQHFRLRVAGNEFPLSIHVAIPCLVPSVGPFSDLANNTSIVLRVIYGGTSFLFTGDAEREEEQAMRI
jgi:hypothetical protein